MRFSKKPDLNNVYDRLTTLKPITVPYNVWVVFGEDAKEIRIADDQASFGCDYKTLPELRTAIEWYAEQLGGKITWEKK
jgi:hypothetical protein